MSTGRKPLQFVTDEWCSDYHCAGDCGMRGHGWQHAQPHEVTPQRKRDTLAAFDALTADARRARKEVQQQVRQRAKDSI